MLRADRNVQALPLDWGLGAREAAVAAVWLEKHLSKHTPPGQS